MLILNLANPDASTIQYKVLRFSDGQVLIDLLGRHDSTHTLIEAECWIYSRMSWDDLQLIITANQRLKLAGFKRVHLYVPYFLGARSDRAFSSAGVNYLRDVICPIIASQGFETVTVMDPHSNCLEMGLKNLRRATTDDFLNFAAEEYTKATGNDKSRIVLVGPDKGSYDRVAHAAQILGVHDVLICDKHRDPLTGQILSIDVGHLADLEGQDLFVVDDICDGAGTFIALAQKLKSFNHGNLYLVLPHGIFSRGFKELSQYYAGVFTTNSFNASLPSRQVIPGGDSGEEMFIKTFNLF